MLIKVWADIMYIIVIYEKSGEGGLLEGERLLETTHGMSKW